MMCMIRKDIECRIFDDPESMCWYWDAQDYFCRQFNEMDLYWSLREKLKQLC